MGTFCPPQSLDGNLLVDGVRIEQKDQSDQPRTDWFRLNWKNGSSTLASFGKLIEKTANVSKSITMTAMLHSHQSRRSSLRSCSWTSARRCSADGSSGCANVARGDEIMTGPAFWRDGSSPEGENYAPFFNSARTSLATSRSVSNTPWPVTATASVIGSPLTCRFFANSWMGRTPGRSRLLSCST